MFSIYVWLVDTFFLVYHKLSKSFGLKLLKILLLFWYISEFILKLLGCEWVLLSLGTTG